MLFWHGAVAHRAAAAHQCSQSIVSSTGRGASSCSRIRTHHAMPTVSCAAHVGGNWLWPTLLFNTLSTSSSESSTQVAADLEGPDDLVSALTSREWNFDMAETLRNIVPAPMPLISMMDSLGPEEFDDDDNDGDKKSNSYGVNGNGKNDHKEGDDDDDDEDGAEVQGYRTADLVRLVRVPVDLDDLLSADCIWQLMVEKQSIYKAAAVEGLSGRPGVMDTFKYCASLNEYETWFKHKIMLRRCPNIVKMYGMQKHGNHISLFSEYCGGGDVQGMLGACATLALSQKCSSGPWGTEEQEAGVGLDEETIREIARGVTAGLDAMHQEGLVYGDLKPGNVFIGEDAITGLRVFKIGDFGTMREETRKQLHYFVTGFGYTPEYAAPEVLKDGSQKGSKQADLWSLGIMLHELYTGKLPRIGAEFGRVQGFPDANRLREAYMKANSTHAALAGLNMSEPFRQVIEACVQQKSKNRPVDAHALLQFDWFTAVMPVLPVLQPLQDLQPIPVVGPISAIVP